MGCNGVNGMYDFSVERNFTKAYQDYIDEHYAVREIRCMEQMFPYLFMDIQPGDKLAGRVRISPIGFSPEPGGLGFYCDADAVKKVLDSYDYPADFQDEIQNMLKFWD